MAAPARAQARRVEERRGLDMVSLHPCPPSLVEEALTAIGVHLLGADDEGVAPRLGLHAGGRIAECLADVRHVHTEAAGGGVHRGIGPDLVEEPFGRDELVGVDQQHGEYGALLPTTERHGPAVDEDLERSQHCERCGHWVRF